MLSQLQQAQANKKGRKRRPIFVSKKIEVLYLTALNALIDEIHKATKNALTGTQIGDGYLVADGVSIQNLRVKYSPNAKELAKKVVYAQKKQSDKLLNDLLIEQTGIDFSALMRDEPLQAVIDDAINANVSLIKSIPQQYFDKVEQAILLGMQGGVLHKTLSDDLQKIHKQTQNRAKLIASDQLGKIHSRLTQVRQQNLGITHYRWSTSRDERVRDSHRHKDGQIFAWSDPPADGHPGFAIRCRCVAIPYTEHLLGGITPNEAIRQQASYQTVSFSGLVVDDKEVERLSFDPATNSHNISEAILMVFLQKHYNSTARRYSKNEVISSQKLGDFVFVDGIMANKAVDFMFTTKDGSDFNIEKMNKHFLDKNGNLSKANKKSIQEHLSKDVAIIPLDLTKLTKVNKMALLDYIETLPNKSRFLLIENI